MNFKGDDHHYRDDHLINDGIRGDDVTFGCGSQQEYLAEVYEVQLHKTAGNIAMITSSIVIKRHLHKISFMSTEHYTLKNKFFNVYR